MIKKQQSMSFSSLQEAFKPLEYDSFKQNEIFEQSWQNKGENKINSGEYINIDNSRLYSSQLIGGDLENINLNGLEMKFEREMTTLKESFIPNERGYHEIPKFLMSYFDLYQNQAPKYEGIDEFQNSKFSNTLLTTQSSSCWSNNLIEQSYLEANTNKIYRPKDENTFLEEDDGILDVLSHALSKTCLDDETIEQINSGDEPCKYNFTNNITSSPTSSSSQKPILQTSGSSCSSSSSNSNLSLTPYVLGLRVFKLINSNKKQVSNFQLNTYDIMNLCSQFGNIVDISINNESHCVTYENRESLERALNSLQNLQISSEGDFIHAYIHQTSNTMIGGLERSMNLVQNKWSHDFNQLNFPNIKEMCGSINFVDNIGIFGNTTTSASTSCRSNTEISASGASTTTNTSTNSPWNSFDSSITTYERNLWTAWLQDNKSNQNNSISKSILNEKCENSNIIQDKIEENDELINQEKSKIKQNANGEFQNTNTNTTNNNSNNNNCNINKGPLSNPISNASSLNNNRTNTITYSSIVGSNLNKNNLVKGISQNSNAQNNENSVICTNNSVGNKPNIQDINAFKLTKIIGKLDELNSDTVEMKNSGNLPPIITSNQSPTSTSSSSSSVSSPSAISTSCQNSSNMLKKYTARYEIQIPPDNQFQIARRIIGTRGINMKRIFKLTQSKLRLRGKGSGYLEGYNKQEADEPLHLCISSTNSEQYINARKLVERLLLKIYQEYDDFLLSNNDDHKTLNLQLKFKETMRTKQLPTNQPNGNNSNNNHNNNNNINNNNAILSGVESNTNDDDLLNEFNF
ncbi:RRM domain-containing and KH domain-containing [Cryptosporidium hominis]